jgi:hypothetical protein
LGVMPGRVLTMERKPEGIEGILIKAGFGKKGNEWESKGVKIIEHHMSRNGIEEYALRVSLSNYQDTSPYEELKKHLPQGYKEIVLKES